MLQVLANLSGKFMAMLHFKGYLCLAQAVSLLYTGWDGDELLVRITS
jgi:hypothetical protein